MVPIKRSAVGSAPNDIPLAWKTERSSPFAKKHRVQINAFIFCLLLSVNRSIQENAEKRVAFEATFCRRRRFLTKKARSLKGPG